MIYDIWYPGWWFQPSWRIYESVGKDDIPYMKWTIKKCSKPPTGICIIWNINHLPTEIHIKVLISDHCIITVMFLGIMIKAYVFCSSWYIILLMNWRFEPMKCGEWYEYVGDTKTTGERWQIHGLWFSQASQKYGSQLGASSKSP